MIASVVQAILEIVFATILEAICYFAGRVIVPIATLGRVKCDSFSSGIQRRKLRWLGLFSRRGSELWLTTDGTTLAGLLALALITGVAICIALS